MSLIPQTIHKRKSQYQQHIFKSMRMLKSKQPAIHYTVNLNKNYEVRLNLHSRGTEASISSRREKVLLAATVLKHSRQFSQLCLETVVDVQMQVILLIIQVTRMVDLKIAFISYLFMKQERKGKRHLGSCFMEETKTAFASI